MASSTGRAFFNAVFPHFPWWLPTVCCKAAALVKIFRNIEGVFPKGPSVVRIPASLDNSGREGISGRRRSRINQGSSPIVIGRHHQIVRIQKNSDVQCCTASGCTAASPTYPSWWFLQLSPKTRPGKITILMKKGYLQETYNLRHSIGYCLGWLGIISFPCLELKKKREK